MYSDRELLALAAKAAGVEIEWRRSAGAYYYDDPETGREEWSPLDDDGQALRLAVKLGMRICVYAEDLVTTVGFNLPSGARKSIHHPHGVDAYAATRRAIVRAAAAIGEGMQ